RTLNISNLDNKDTPNNIDKTIVFFSLEVTTKITEVRYTFKKRTYIYPYIRKLV
ncbi:hypothetical protein B0T13DRAFT_390787, partial [Neurospora crassa]